MFSMKMHAAAPRRARKSTETGKRMLGLSNPSGTVQRLKPVAEAKLADNKI